MHSTKIEFRLAGIPCLLEVFPGDDWRILDRRGRPAQWLERKIHQANTDRRLEILDEIQCAIHDEFEYGPSDAF